MYTTPAQPRSCEYFSPLFYFFPFVLKSPVNSYGYLPHPTLCSSSGSTFTTLGVTIVFCKLADRHTMFCGILNPTCFESATTQNIVKYTGGTKIGQYTSEWQKGRKGGENK